MIIMTVGDSYGERRCTARCYNASGDKCVCCCGGRNHGIGLQKALEQNEEMLPEDTRILLQKERMQLQLAFEG